ncbi:DUF5696 domain-containing protein [Paenibacillus sp. XY044]|uniref:DUF5696 domain-containing protein n=1 Tax=Paenibacillus sp. XY044 TaxID=2026089 RepID=UPI000B996E81|nr:DUF5696 domain-containing protein [Paenibacillus sp. XY044]OZB98223.1 hypothetical protein CJP46_03395 [Paenibacillus sp. XY044]
MTRAKERDFKLTKLLPAAVCVLIAAAAGIYIWTHSVSGTSGAAEQAQAAQADIPADLQPAVSTSGDLPNDADFVQVAETGTLVLYADKHTGHFKVRDKRDGHELRSYPNPDDWQYETISGNWRSNLLSPIMMETVDTTKQTEILVSSLLSQKGGITSWKPVENGFAVTFALPSLHLIIPVEVTIKDDYVVTKVIDSGIAEGKDQLLSLKTYPFLGASQPRGQEGYILLPDGSGAIYNLKENITNDRSVYREPIYGPDSAYTPIFTNRNPVTMPIYGIKSGSSAFLAVADQGAEYGDIYAAQSGVYSKYAWATIEQEYRMQYFQPTSVDHTTGFNTYSKARLGEDRVVRYYVLPESASDYSGMAAKYRQYLMEEQNMKQLQTAGSPLPLFLDIIGGDSQKGFLQSKYIPGTTTDEAQSILDRLHSQGIPLIVATYQGWQTGGVSRFGFGTQVDKHLGGNAGMKSLAEYTKSKGDTLLLETNYSMNTDGGDFNPKREAMQDQSGGILKFNRREANDQIALVSAAVSLDRIKSRIDSFKALGVDGLAIAGTGSNLDSDYNRKYAASRSEAAKLQQEFINTVKSKFSTVTTMGGNAYALQKTNAVRFIPGDYSYDLFLDEAVPFAQMVLHGLVPYTMNWGNARDEYQKDFLRSIEYGAAPTFGVMHAKTETMKRAYSVWQYSLNFDEWEPSILQEYKRFSEALRDVQDQFITSNRTVASNVKETVYANGQKIIVNYNDAQVTVDGRQIPGNDFIVVKGGEEP